MPEQRPALIRAELPAQFTVETIRDLPIATVRRLSDHRNGILSDDEQRVFDQLVQQVMRDSAERISRQRTGAEWSALRREQGARPAQSRRAPSRADQQLDRLARQIGQQVDLAETLAPNVDWSFAQPGSTPSGSNPDDEDAGTVADLEQRITDQVELVAVMSEIADISKRTFSLEQQRDLQSTRGVFFGLVVSVAVLVAGWAPLVDESDWTDRLWIIGLTVGTCLIAALVYALIRRWQNRRISTDEDVDDDTTGQATAAG